MLLQPKNPKNSRFLASHLALWISWALASGFFFFSFACGGPSSLLTRLGLRLGFPGPQASHDICCEPPASSHVNRVNHRSHADSIFFALICRKKRVWPSLTSLVIGTQTECKYFHPHNRFFISFAQGKKVGCHSRLTSGDGLGTAVNLMMKAKAIQPPIPSTWTFAGDACSGINNGEGLKQTFLQFELSNLCKLVIIIRPRQSI